MTIETCRHGEKFEVLLNEPLTAADHQAFREILSKIQKNGKKEIVLDLSNLTWIDSAGLGMFLLAKEAADRAGLELVMRSPKGHVRELVELGQFDRMIRIES